MFHDPKNKPIVFMLSAALGCLIAAVLAEVFLFALPKGTPVQVQSICLTIDVSGSMAGDRLADIQRAAKQFVDKRSGDDLAITIFSSDARVLVPFTKNSGELKKNIDDLLAYGGTNFERALEVSAEAFERLESRNKTLLIFTDGASSVGDAMRALRVAQQLRQKGVRIFTVATKDADEMYLAGLTGHKNQVISAQDGQFGEAFATAEKMVATTIGGGSGSLTIAFIATVGWTVFISLGIALALVAIQNYFMKKPLLPQEQAVLVAAGAALAGLASGFVAQTAMTALSAIHLGEVGRVLAWAVLGGLLAFGMTFVIPNLDKTKALGFGALGGFLGSIGFLMMTTVMGELGGRWLGAFILGACVGLLVAIVETYYRNVWLMVIYDPRNFSQVNLGSQAVTVGSGAHDTVPIPNVGTKAGTFLVVGDHVQYTDAHGKQSLVPGNRVKVGKVELVICSKDVPFAPSKFYPMKMSRARELMNKKV